MTSVLTQAIGTHPPTARALRTTDGRSVSYGELLQLTSVMAGGLAERGVTAGQAVAFVLRNSVEYVAAILAVAELGARYVPLLASFDDGGVSRALARTAPALLVTDGHREVGRTGLPTVRGSELARSTAAPPPPGDAPHQGVFRTLWSSGSTGFPKTIAWRQDTLLSERLRWLADTGITSSDIFFCRHPLDVAHATDLHMFAALLSGSELVLADPTAPPEELLHQLADSRATVMSALPRHYEDLVRARQQPRRVTESVVELSRLRLPLCGGAYLSPQLVHDARRILGIGIRQIYGSTEFGLAMGGVRVEESAAGAMLPVAGVGTRLAPLPGGGQNMHATRAVGELVLYSDCTSEGYVEDAEANSQTFRHPEFWTGDVTERLPGGAYRVLGRASETLAAVDGLLLAPMLDEEIAADGAAAEVCSLPVRPGEHSDEVTIVVVPADTRDERAVTAAAVKILTRHGLRGEVHLASSLPRTSVGKIDKPRLRSTLRPGTGRAVPS